MIHYNIVKTKLNFMEEKPENYKIRQLCYPTITEKAIVEYIANSASIPKSTVKAAVIAIGEAISYFVINGHRVNFDGFGSFYLKVRTKTAEQKEELTAEHVKGTTIGFQASTELAKMAKNVNVASV